MKLFLVRKIILQNHIIGMLSRQDGYFICFTSEGAGAIACGEYEITLEDSRQYGRRLPRLIDHDVWFNEFLDPAARGIVVGMTKEKDSIVNGRVALDWVIRELEYPLRTDRAFLVITDSWKDSR